MTTATGAQGLPASQLDQWGGIYPHPTRVVRAVCALDGITCSDLLSQHRWPELIAARESITGCCRELVKASFPDIARAMGRRSHSATWDQYQRWLRRPAQERRDLVVRVLAQIEGVA